MSETTELVTACPRCGTERRVYKCECTPSRRIDPVEMPAVVAERLRELRLANWKPRRLTASPSRTTVWVQDVSPDRRGLEVLIRPQLVQNAAASTSDSWVRFTRAEWEELRDCIDKYFESSLFEAEARS